MKKHPILYLIFGIIILLVPNITYLCILMPKLSEEYNILMTSGGIIGGAGMYAGTKIPEKLKYSGMFKLASNAFTIMTILLLVEKFIIPLIGLVAVFIISFIIFKIFMELYKNGKRQKENRELATEIARNIIEITK